MDEMNTEVLTEETASQAETGQDATEENAAETEQDTTPAQADAEGTEQGNRDTAEQGETEQEAGAEQGTGDSAPFLSVRYNHQTRELSQSEAQTAIQMAMKNEPVFAELRQLAALKGEESIASLVKNMRETLENERREALRGKLVDSEDSDMLETILQAETAKIREKAGLIARTETEALQSESENENARLADEFVALQTEFPEIEKFKDVPPAVLQLAEKNSISLLDAQLRFQFAENKKIKQAEQSAAAAAEASAGSAASQDADSSSPEIEAMLKGIRQ